MNNISNLTNKTVVITGASGVLCSELARTLGAAGAKLALVSRSETRAGELAHEIIDAGGSAVVIKSNVLDKAALIAAKQRINTELGRIDILINGVGGNRKEATTSPDMAFFDIPPDAIRHVFDVNFLGVLLPTQVFAADMADAGAGNILNISSMNALRPLTRIPAYSAAKAAVSNLTQWLAVHMAQNYSKNIRVNAIAPGFFLTEQNKFLLTDEQTGELTDRGKSIIDHTPMGEFGKPEDLVGTVLWLLSDASRFVTGTVIPVDGGFSAFSGV
jgi:NAD(P)-dependent dehydrogenase (short-subunit alcohol dehydrogenase family)